MRLCGGGKVFGGEKARESFFSGAFFTVNLSTRGADCLRFSAFFLATEHRHMCGTFLRVRNGKIDFMVFLFLSLKSRAQVGRNSSHLQWFLLLLISQKWQPLELQKIRSIEEKRKRLENDSLKDIASMIWANILRKARITPELKRSTGLAFIGV